MTSPQASLASDREPGTVPAFDVPPDMRPLAWAGWWLPVPGSFRLHDIDGNYKRGRIALADADQMRLELAWDAVANPNFDAERFARRELLRGLRRSERATAKIERVGSRGACLLFRIAPVLPPHPGPLPVGEGESGFAVSPIGSPSNARIAGKSHPLSHRERDGVRGKQPHSFRRADRTPAIADWQRYVGFCPVTRRAFTIRYRHGVPRENDLLASSLRDYFRGQPLDEGQRWAFFSIGFVAPPRFEYERATLNLGDMSVQLIERRRGRQPRVVVRQIHPAKLALNRFDLAGWLEHLLAAESRTYQPAYRQRFPRRDPVIEPGSTPLGPCVSADSRLRSSLRPMLGLRHHRHRRTWLIHDETGDRLVAVQVSHERELLQSTFETVLRGLHRTERRA